MSSDSMRAQSTLEQMVALQLGQAQQLHKQGRLAQATAICDEILARVPGHIAAMQLKATLYREQGELAPAEALLKRLEQRYPNHPDILYEYALLRHAQGRVSEATELLKRVIKLNPNHAFAHMVLGRLYTREGMVAAADHHLGYALKLRPDDELICQDLASVLATRGLFDTAESLFRRAYSMNTESTGSLLDWAKMEEKRNRLERAAELVDFARQRDPDNHGVKLIEGVVLRRQGKLESASRVLAELEGLDLNHEARSYWQRELGNLYDRMGRFDEAFAAYQEAARIGREYLGLRYRGQESQQMFDRLRTFFHRERVEEFPRGKCEEGEEHLPIFIVGFPRSGTTLVEQILSSHPNIAAGDELHVLMGLVDKAPEILHSKQPYPECLDRLRESSGEQQVQVLRHAFMQMVCRQGVMEPGKGRFTDKTPLNETHLGLIHLMFPDVPIVHLIRHPLDVVLSSFFNDVRHGGHFASSLVDTAKHYAMTQELVQQYREELDLNYLPLRYENLVEDLEGNSRRLLDFVGEPWDDRCLAFHKNERQARTASSAQIKEKIYTRSKFRYKGYRKHLDEIVTILAPHIERLGYMVEDE